MWGSQHKYILGWWQWYSVAIICGENQVKEKNILLSATTRPLLGIAKDDGKKKPAQYKLYNFTEGGTAECDKRSESYCCKPKSKKWTIVALCYVLDMARINAGTIFALNHNESPWKSPLSSFDFGCNLTQVFILPFIKARSIHGLNKAIQLKPATVLEESVKPRNQNLNPKTQSKKRTRKRSCDCH